MSDRHGVEVFYYSLAHIACVLGLKPQTLIPKLHKENVNICDRVAADCMAAICESFDPNFIVEPNRELEGIRRLPDLWAKSKERPDIIVLY